MHWLLLFATLSSAVYWCDAATTGTNFSYYNSEKQLIEGNWKFQACASYEEALQQCHREGMTLPRLDDIKLFYKALFRSEKGNSRNPDNYNQSEEKFYTLDKLSSTLDHPHPGHGEIVCFVVSKSYSHSGISIVFSDAQKSCSTNTTAVVCVNKADPVQDYLRNNICIGTWIFYSINVTMIVIILILMILSIIFMIRHYRTRLLLARVFRERREIYDDEWIKNNRHLRNTYIKGASPSWSAASPGGGNTPLLFSHITTTPTRGAMQKLNNMCLKHNNSKDTQATGFL